MIQQSFQILVVNRARDGKEVDKLGGRKQKLKQGRMGKKDGGYGTTEHESTNIVEGEGKY